MINEEAYTYTIQLMGNDFTEDSMIKPIFYQNSIQYVAERHLNLLQLDTTSMASHGMAWVLVGMTIEVQKAVTPDHTHLVGKTWHAQTKAPYFRREFVFMDETGEPVFYGASFSVVLDLNTRHILRRFTLPQEMGQGNGVLLMQNIRPTFRETAEYALWGARPVYNSYLDILGHVNNTRYCEFAFDALTEAEKRRPIRKIALNFTGELRSGEQFEVYKGQVEETVFLKGVRTSDGKKSFDVAFTFGEPGSET